MIFIPRRRLLILHKKKEKKNVKIIQIMKSNLKLNTEMTAEAFTKPNAKLSILRVISVTQTTQFPVKGAKGLVTKENVP